VEEFRLKVGMLAAELGRRWNVRPVPREQTRAFDAYLDRRWRELVLPAYQEALRAGATADELAAVRREVLEEYGR
jgi:hypothetical protein